MSNFKIVKKYVTLIYLMLSLRFILSEQQTLLDSNTSLCKCRLCKIFTDSFEYWSEKTARGKFEGGDAVWEETKLRTYARSEIRLVEIQEGLCSELKDNKDQCYSLAEETEVLLEKWWFHNSSDLIDFYTWLCIDLLKYCCPNLHFGESCLPCLLDKKSQICGGKGKCDGEGTRKGNGTCLCDKGYVGQHCSDCADNYFKKENGDCEKCHKSCNGCLAEGSQSCVTCKNGWQLKAGFCLDVNECDEGSVCNNNQYCINKVGSYTCKQCDKACKTCSGEGPSKCKSCYSSYSLWGGSCVDDEQKTEIITNLLKRLGLYSFLFFILYFISRRSMPLGSIIVVVISVFIYFMEKLSLMSFLEVILPM